MIEVKKPLLPAAAVILAAAALLAGGKFPYLFFYLAVLILLIPYLWLRMSLRKLRGDIEVSSSYGEVGQTLTVDYKVDNSPSGRFPYLELTNIIGGSFSAPEENKLVTLEAGEAAIYRREVKCTRRGKYDIKTFQVKTGDPFGVFKLARPLATGKEINVYPRLKVYPEVTLPARQHFGSLAVRDKQFENYSQVSDLREWQDSDSVKKIHWKQSARHNNLVVKNFERKADASLNIFLDMLNKSYRHDKNHALEDLAVEAAASLIYLSLKENVPVQVFSEPLPGGRLHGRHLRDYRGIMDSIITLSPRGKRAFAAYVNSYTYYLSPNSSLYLFTPLFSLTDAALLLRLRQRGFFPVLFYIAFFDQEPDESNVIDKVKEAGIKVHTLHPTEENEDAG